MTRAQFLKVLAEVGATLDTETEDCNLNVDAPKGKVFRDNLCHTIVTPWNNAGGQSWKTLAYAESAERASMGLYDCDDPNCDVCYGEVLA